MSRSTILSLASLFMFACAPAADSGDEATTSDTPSEPQSREALAMSAGPAGVSAEATLMDRGENGELVMLREGTNGWLCVTDENPNAPGEYPICMDGAWQTWFGAFMAGETPEIGVLGTSYMLQGGPAASNTDPMAVSPPEGEEWLMDPPHLMLIVPDPAMLEGYPTAHMPDRPYVMWAGTPYAHLMVPSTVN